LAEKARTSPWSPGALRINLPFLAAGGMRRSPKRDTSLPEMLAEERTTRASGGRSPLASA
jgi:hypothetical protein